jgi:transposase-like protein
MPWKECHVMDERLRFVARRLEGESMSSLCEEFGISRKTGYKIFERYQPSQPMFRPGAATAALRRGIVQ